LDAIRGRAITASTTLLAAVAIYFTARNAAAAQRTARGVQESSRAAALNAEIAQQGLRQAEEVQRRSHELIERGQLTDRFTAAVGQLGDVSHAVQLGGVHALAHIADDSPSMRQTCIDGLCAYVRLPYPPEPAEDDPAYARYRAQREVRHTVLRLIGEHLRLPAESAASWQHRNFDFTGAVFDGADLHGAIFSGGRVLFTDAEFRSGTLNLLDSHFCGSDISFWNAKFTGGRVDLWRARFSAGWINFMTAEFAGSRVSFWKASFTGGLIEFRDAKFSAGRVRFRQAEFIGSRIRFQDATFTGTELSFESSTGPAPEGLLGPGQVPQGVVVPSRWQTF
jgi:hypothetical protein